MITNAASAICDVSAFPAGGDAGAEPDGGGDHDPGDEADVVVEAAGEAQDAQDEHRQDGERGDVRACDWSLRSRRQPS